MIARFVSILFVLSFFSEYAYSYPEKGKWSFLMESPYPQTVLVSKSIFKGGNIQVQVVCEHMTDGQPLHVVWFIDKIACWRNMIEEGPTKVNPFSIVEKLKKTGESRNHTELAVFSQETINCNERGTYLSLSNEKLHTLNDQSKKLSNLNSTDGVSNSVGGIVVRRDAASPTMVPSTLYQVEADGLYRLLVGIIPVDDIALNTSVNVNIDIHSDYGYLSAIDYPLLIFYSVMCAIYVLYGIGWLIISFTRWKELLRVQYWIGAVIFLGMLEKAVYTGFYEGVNKQGTNLPGILVFAEVISCAKRTLSRMLVIIVSFGFGIVKPRLGVVFHRVVAIGTLYFVIATYEACSRSLKSDFSRQDVSKLVEFSEYPLALIDTFITYWVFSALINTTRTLRLRRNDTKLQLYKHFTNTLAFGVVTSFIFMCWVIKNQNLNPCVEDWKQLWVTTAFWHVFFATILLVIMILWRPTNNNQRFAFSPLLDDGSDEENENLVAADVSDTMKLRSSRSTQSSPKPSKSVEEDLQWLDENIHPAMVDSGSAAIVDSDEEIIITKFEMSKMQ